MKTLKTFFPAAMAAIFLGAGGAGAFAADNTTVADSMRAVVNDVPITQQEVELLVDPEERYLFEQFARTQPDVYRRRVIALRENGAEELITRQVILHDFKENIKVPETFVDDYVNDEIKEKFPDRTQLTKQLESEGITLEQIKQKYRDRFVVEQMRFLHVKDPIISPKKIEDYYTLHRDEFKVEDQIKMRMIVLSKTSPDAVESARKRAEEILSQVKGGASFEELARSYSEGSQRQEGGETGWEDLSVLNKDLAAELVKLKPGEHTGVIETQDGFYLLLLEDRHPAHFKPINDLRPQIERILAAQETERLSKQWIERLKKKTFVKYF